MARKKTSKKKPSQGRRMPSQVRSKATVEAILIAAAQILEREGPEGATTNAIAALAGVSIGSLYQYFDDREAIIEALASRHAEQLQTMLSRALGELMGKPLPEGIAGLMVAIIVVHRVNPGLDRALLQYGGLSEAGAVDDIE
ncbi:MAG: TetR/AcrR family transcriptional regulator, partial [Myxococcales bacterium]|nr:TetR/AcrR family transcriptional regulator [Myxococcales bacterium]